ncbi:hypothetical protein C7974DRAFT_412758 [Boeremia exigua]|uniref:uncharacterized protein n=1 Tax=Boeremia exigua TaxID=749465 RepID=UPI001E8DE36A|nr:uncharacterized protein C7974DRAFT_412758 [Boeremia exigua]KAH6633788.1 hypothetical protein C7974DRAFT_412758 [Boeremia exigua]
MRRRFRELSFLADYQDPPEPGSCEDYPLRIYNNLKINTPTPLWITSPTELEVNGVLMVPTKPFCISVPLYTLVFSMAPLGPAFAKGWSKLPSELKVEILAHNLVIDPERGVSSFSDVRETFLEHLQMTPEIAELAKHVFYKMNVFNVAQIRNLRLVYAYPSSIFNGMIQKVMITVTDGWLVVSRIAQASHGLSGLRHVSVGFHYARKWDTFVAGAMDVQFRCRGEIFIFGGGPFESERNVPSIQDQMDYLKSRISFLP